MFQDALYYGHRDDYMVFLKGSIEMKSRIITTVAVVTAIVCVSLLFAAAVAYPMHIGEPSYYHVARVDCLVAACTCALVSIASAIASAH